MYMLCRSFDPLSREATLLNSGIEIVIFVCKFINTINMLRKSIRRTNFKASTVVTLLLTLSSLIPLQENLEIGIVLPSQRISQMVPFCKTYHFDPLPPKSLCLSHIIYLVDNLFQQSLSVRVACNVPRLCEVAD